MAEIFCDDMHVVFNNDSAFKNHFCKFCTIENTSAQFHKHNNLEESVKPIPASECSDSLATKEQEQHKPIRDTSVSLRVNTIPREGTT